MDIKLFTCWWRCFYTIAKPDGSFSGLWMWNGFMWELMASEDDLNGDFMAIKVRAKEVAVGIEYIEQLAS